MTRSFQRALVAMKAMGVFYIIGGLTLTMAAVGGMDDPTRADHFTVQLITALIGLLWAWVGTRLLER